MDKKRSKGVTISGIIVIIFGLLPVIGGIVMSTSAVVKLGSDISFIWTWNDNSAFQTLRIYVVYSIFFMAGVGILKLKNWSRILLITLMAINITGALAGLSLTVKNTLSGRLIMPELMGSFISLLLSGVVIYFFTRPKVKEQFKSKI